MHPSRGKVVVKPCGLELYALTERGANGQAEHSGSNRRDVYHEHRGHHEQRQNETYQGKPPAHRTVSCYATVAFPIPRSSDRFVDVCEPC
jgi:hypothetical protein